MACENRCWQKSAQQAFAQGAQAYAAEGTNVMIRGALATDTGESIETDAGAFRFVHGGLFRVSVDLTTTPTAAGDQVLQLYLDGVPMEDAIATDTVAANGVVTQHVETVRRIVTCCALTPRVTARVSGVAGVINHVSANAVKLA